LGQRQRRTGILVPLFEDYLNHPYGYWDQDDQQFLARLMVTTSRREVERRKSPTYSPSSLGGCLRKAYLGAHAKELGIKQLRVLKAETQHLFWAGTWAHLRLQLRLHQLHKHGYLRLVGVEVSVGGDEHHGTVDAIIQPQNSDDLYVVDFKHVNNWEFQKVVDKDVSEQYKIQLAAYARLVNQDKKLPDVTGALLVAERKSGPTPLQPAALAEYRVNLKVNGRKVQERLEELRQHAKANTIPDPECTSLTQAQFTSCPFRAYCREEVKAVERDAKADSGDSPKYRTRVPAKRGANRTG